MSFGWLFSTTNVVSKSSRLPRVAVRPPLQVMAREMFNPNLALFVQVPEGGTTFQPNPNSVVQSDSGTNHLDYFK